MVNEITKEEAKVIFSCDNMRHIKSISKKLDLKKKDVSKIMANTDSLPKMLKYNGIHIDFKYTHEISSGLIEEMEEKMADAWSWVEALLKDVIEGTRYESKKKFTFYISLENDFSDKIKAKTFHQSGIAHSGYVTYIFYAIGKK
jgi:hypothetical protein